MIEKSTKCSFCFKEIKSHDIKSSFKKYEKSKEKYSNAENELNRLKKIKDMKNLSTLLFDKKYGFNNHLSKNNKNIHESNKKRYKDDDNINNIIKERENDKDIIQEDSINKQNNIHFNTENKIPYEVSNNQLEREYVTEMNLHENINFNLKKLIEFLHINQKQSIGALSYSLPVPTIPNRTIDVR